MSYENLHVCPILQSTIGQTCKISYDKKNFFLIMYSNTVRTWRMELPLDRLRFV